MKKLSSKRFLFSALCSVAFSFFSFGAHIVGGDITAKYLSPNNYEVTVVFFRDCSGGGAGFPGIGAEPPMYIGVYDKTTHAQQQIITMSTPTITIVGMGDACYVPSSCVEKGIYITNVSIPDNSNGYYLSWLRCCRNNSIANIVTPGNEGSIFYAEIPDPAIINSSPVFNTVPQGSQGYMCQNYLNAVDFSATDADGDQLVYSLSAPLSCNPTAQCSSTLTSPSTSSANLPGPYGTITWNPGYSTPNPFGIATTTLSATSGLLSIIPSNLGVYALSVKVEEFRASVKIGEIVRDFQFEVLACQRLNIAIQPSTTICTGQTTTLTASGALAGWTYSWNPSGQTGTAITVLATSSGTYNYTATATNGVNCITNNTSFTVAGPTASVSVSGNVCLGQAISLTASGGTTYSWDNGETTAVLTGVPSGMYTVTVGNGTGCIATATGVINTPLALTSSVSVNNVPCSGNPAYASATVTGGTGSYTYAWIPSGQSTQTATGLVSGDHTLTVTDSQSCTATNTFSIVLTDSPTLSVSTTSVGCVVSNGTATANASGGAPGYTYAWDNGQTTQTATGLAAGNYSVTVSDMNGCSVSGNATVTNTSGISVSLDSVSNVKCYGNNTGKIYITPTGGSGSYTYAWSNSASTQDITGLSMGTYSVEVTDANNCSFTLSANVTEPALLTAIVTATNETCFANSNGAVDLSVSGGTTAYSYSWAPGGATTQDISGLNAGSYSVMITDNQGCTATASATITSPATLTVSVAGVIPAGCNSSDGMIFLTDDGGTPPYTYTWQPGGATDSAAIGLSSGNYSVVITDDNGCSASIVISLEDSCDYVWPGDANDDGVANNLDILAIGIGNGSTGPVRAGATLNWVGQPCAGWSNTLASGSNYKHIDCNGDGTVGDADTLAVVQNYGKVHNNKTVNPIVNGNTDIYTLITTDSIGSGGAWVTVQIGLGTASSPATNVYGVAYSVNFSDPSLVDLSSVAFTNQNSWLGTLGSDLISVGFPNSDAAVTRTDQANASGNGIIQILKFKTSSSLNSTGNTVALVVTVSNATVLSNDETIIPVNVLPDSVIVKDTLMSVPTTTGGNNLSSQVNIYPNPSTGQITISYPANSQEISISDVLGRNIFRIIPSSGSKTVSVDLGDEPAGIYLLQIRSADRLTVEKIIKE